MVILLWTAVQTIFGFYDHQSYWFAVWT